MANLRMCFCAKVIEAKKLIGLAIYLESNEGEFKNKKRELKTFDALDVTEITDHVVFENTMYKFVNSVVKKVELSLFEGGVPLFEGESSLLEEANKIGNIALVSTCENNFDMPIEALLSKKKKKKKKKTKEDKVVSSKEFFSGEMYYPYLKSVGFLKQINFNKDFIKRVDYQYKIASFDIKVEMLSLLRDFKEKNESLNEVVVEPLPEVINPVLTLGFNKPNSISKYDNVIDIQTDGSVRMHNGEHIIAFGGNFVKRELGKNIFYNFKRMCGFERLKENSQYAELKAVEAALIELEESHKDELISQNTLVKVYIDNIQVVDVLKSGFMWNNATSEALAAFYSVKKFQSKYAISFTKVSSKANKGNNIAHNLAKKAYRIAVDKNKNKAVEDYSVEFMSKIKNHYYLKRANDNYNLLVNNLNN